MFDIDLFPKWYHADQKLNPCIEWEGLVSTLTIQVIDLNFQVISHHYKNMEVAQLSLGFMLSSYAIKESSKESSAETMSVVHTFSCKSERSNKKNEKL